MDTNDEIPSSSSSIFRDISNFKTPKRPSNTNPNFHSPSCFSSSLRHRPSSSVSARRSTTKKSTVAARKLKAYEQEQSKSSRKAQIKKVRSLKSLAKSITVWLNFLFECPATCGCEFSIGGVKIGNVDCEVEGIKGKRDFGNGVSIGVDKTWRTPKRQRKMWSLKKEDSVGNGNENVALELSSSVFLSLRESLEDVCSFDDLKMRMGVYLSLGSCKEIFEVMNHVAKNIDDGRLKLKPHCPIVTDLGLKTKAIGILMCYNPIWLRIGLYIIFGGDSLVPNGDDDSEQDTTFLKMVIEKQFFSHVALAKSYAYNKMVDGIYRPGYYEKLGNVILKRILLLVLTLDRIKSQSSLSLKYGIDGLDGGSPLLFKLDSWIKSSGQVISEFLSSEVMHGEGNLLAHLVIIGYKVSHHQGPLVEYDFKVKDLFKDLQDGLKLCRAIQLLQHDASILTKIAAPSDSYKKNLANCVLALQYLKQAGVSLHDEDNMMIVAEDVASGDKELVLSLLWNIFVHLQLPLLVDKSSIVEEIGKIRGLGVDTNNCANSSSLELLLNWIQAVCENYDCRIDNFDSLVDGKAIWCLLDYYFRKELHNSCLLKEVNMKSGKESIMSINDYSDAVYNFILSQRLTTLLGNFPEVLQISDLLEYNGPSSERSVVILLVFLARQLFVKRNVDQLNFHKLLGCECQSQQRKHWRMEQCLSNSGAVQKPDASDVHENEDAATKFKAIQAWWQDMAERNQKSYMKQAVCRPIDSSANIKRETAAITIQSHFRRLLACRMFLKMNNAASLLQTVFRAWQEARQESSFTFVQGQNFSSAITKKSETYKRYAMFFVHRHSFLKLKRSTLLIQRAVRSWLSWRHQQGSSTLPYLKALDQEAAATIVQNYFRGWMARSRYNHMLDQKEKASYLYSQKVMLEVQTKAAIKIQLAWKRYMCCKSAQKHFYAIIIQRNFRRWRLRRIYLSQIHAILRIQSYFRMSASVKTFQRLKMTSKAAIIIQSFTRAWIARKEEKASYLYQQKVLLELQTKAAIRIQLAWKRYMCFKSAQKHLCAIIIQSNFRRWRLRSIYLNQIQAALRIQSYFRMSAAVKTFQRLKKIFKAAIIIQSFTRAWIARKEEKASYLYQQKVLLELQTKAAIRIQLAWKRFMCYKSAQKHFYAIIIQRNFRRWRLRRIYLSQIHAILRIQSYFRMSASVKTFQRLKMTSKAAIIIQSFTRAWIGRKEMKALYLYRKKVLLELQTKAAIRIQLAWKRYMCCKSAQKHFCATIIQSNFRRWWLRRIYLNKIHAALRIQSYFRMSASVKTFQCLKKTLKAAIIIQSFTRAWIAQKEEKALYLYRQKVLLELQTKAAIRIQLAWKRYMCCKSAQKHFCATIIQSNFRRWRLRQIYLNQIQAALTIQSYFRMLESAKTFQQFKMTFKAAVMIQSFTRAWIAQKEACARRSGIVAIQRHCRAWLGRRNFIRQRGAAMKIQSIILSLKYQRALKCQKDAVLQIQRFIRGYLSRNRLLGGACEKHDMILNGCVLGSVGHPSFESELELRSVLKLQRWWKGFLLHKLRTKSVIIIQSCARGWLARRMATVRRHHVVVIQSHWKGYLARKESKELRDLRLRMKESARNVDDSKRLINRLLVALSELLHMKSVSGILHTCATLDVATEHSQRCCEELVAAGAIDKLLTLIRSVSRSIPDQEVLKHALSTLRNLARYPHLLELLIQRTGSIQAIFWVLLRNKEESYFIASDILMKISSTPKGVDLLRKLPALVKRLHALVEDLTRKAIFEKKNVKSHSTTMKENRERRLKEAAGILKLITSA